jgi:flagellar biosynthesis/type III secretory pathway protein FliH
MQYVTTIERRAIQKGIEQGIKQGIEQGLQMGAISKGREAVLEILATRFETVPPAIAARLETIEDSEVLRQLLQKAILVSSPADFLALLPDEDNSDDANSFRTTNGTG